MENSKLIELLKSLSGREREHLKEFAVSQFFNQNTRISHSLDLLLHHIENHSEKDVNKEKLFKDVFPGLKYDDLKLRHLLSDVLRLTEKFMAVQHFLHNELSVEIETLHALHEKKLEKHFISAEKKAGGI